MFGENVEGVVQQLKSKEVVFEHHDDIRGVTREGDVHIAGNMKVSWFKDPDGNVLNIADR